MSIQYCFPDSADASDLKPTIVQLMCAARVFMLVLIVNFYSTELLILKLIVK